MTFFSWRRLRRTNTPHVTPRTKPQVEPLEDRTVPSFLAAVASDGGFAAIGDFNNDGRSDLVVVDQTAGTVATRLANDDGTFQPAGPAVAASVGAVRVADFDGDGNTDVLYATGRQLALLRGNGDGTLLSPTYSTTSTGFATTSRIVAVADLNGDTRPDVVARVVVRSLSRGRGGPSGWNEYLKILAAQSDGSFAVTQSMTIGHHFSTRGGRSSQTSSSQASPYAIHAGDFDGDGRQDVMVIGQRSKNAYPSRLLLGNGDGTVRGGPDVRFIGDKTVVVSDLNGDGENDLLKKRRESSWRALLGNGDGTFAERRTVNLPGAPVFADVNGDGRSDLLAMHGDAGTVSVYLSNRKGRFKPAQTFATGPGPLTTMTTGDFNGDGRPDLATSNPNSTFVLLNDGNW